jgi:hypothetical protein
MSRQQHPAASLLPAQPCDTYGMDMYIMVTGDIPGCLMALLSLSQQHLNVKAATPSKIPGYAFLCSMPLSDRRSIACWPHTVRPCQPASFSSVPSACQGPSPGLLCLQALESSPGIPACPALKVKPSLVSPHGPLSAVVTRHSLLGQTIQPAGGWTHGVPRCVLDQY